MKLMPWAICALFLVPIALFSEGPQPHPPLLKAAELEADVAVLRRTYEQLHPGLYRYNTKAEMDARFDALAHLMNHDQTLADAYLNFSLFAAQIKCGHTSANFFNQPASVVDELFRSQTRVPFYFEWVDNAMVVTRDFTPQRTLPRGTRILAIDEIPTSVILARLMTVAPADGSNDAARLASLDVTGDVHHETFDIFYPLMFPSNSSRMTLLVRAPKSRQDQFLKVDALTYEQRLRSVDEVEFGGIAAFGWDYLYSGAAYLRMPTWDLARDDWDWKAWLNQHLDELADRKAPSLIIDLRGNDGASSAGKAIGNLILARLATKPIAVSQNRRLVRYRTVPSDLLPYLSNSDPSATNWGSAAVELPISLPTVPGVQYFSLSQPDNEAESREIEPAGKHFTGKVYVLVDTNNTAATLEFAQIIQHQKLGLLVGEATGGSQRGINGGSIVTVGLPNSKIELDVPLVGTFAPEKMPDVGLTPDIVIKRKLRDIEEAKDPALSAVGERVRPHGITPPPRWAR